MAKLIEEESQRFSDPDDLTSQIREFVKLKASMDILDKRSKELREKLFSALDLNGEEDNNGNIILAFDEPIDGVRSLEKQRRVSRKLNEPLAESIIDEKGIGDRVYEVKRVINEEALMAAFYEDLLTEDELDSMFPANVVWALRTVKK